MPLKHLDDDYVVWPVFRRITFWMTDDRGGFTRCRINHEVLEDYAKSQKKEGRNAAQLFEPIRPIIEDAASAAYDRGVIDKEGRVTDVLKSAMRRPPP